MSEHSSNVFVHVRHALALHDADEKISAVFQLAQAWRQGGLTPGPMGEPLAIDAAGLPKRLQLVAGAKVPKRGVGTREGREVLMHAVAHIEFNAINLALDAVQRFPNMPDAFYADWLQVAEEEAYHFSLIRAHLRHLGADYGDFPAHAGLWEMCEKTAHDVLARMALVPRVLEARGLDVTPGMQEKLLQAGDAHAVSLLDIILRDEIGHVEIGNRWFRYCCDERSLDHVQTFQDLLAAFYPRGLMGPFNLDARRQAGFSEHELRLFGATCKSLGG